MGCLLFFLPLFEATYPEFPVGKEPPDVLHEVLPSVIGQRTAQGAEDLHGG